MHGAAGLRFVAVGRLPRGSVRHGLGRRRLRLPRLLQAAFGPEGARIDPGEFGPHQEDLRRVVDPHQHHHQRSRGAEARGHAAAADVHADQPLADRKQRSGDDCTEPDVLPAHLHPRHQLVDHREHTGRQHEADHQIDDLQHRLPAAEQAAPPFAQRRHDRTENERHHQQEGKPQDQPERQQPGSDHRPHPARAGTRGRPPDAIQRVLQLGKHGGRAHQHEHQPDQRAEHALRRLADADQNALDRLRRLVAEQAAQLAEDLATRRVHAEHQAGDRDDDQQQRRHREHGVVRQRSAHARRVVVQPCAASGLDQLPPLGRFRSGWYRRMVMQAHSRQRSRGGDGCSIGAPRVRTNLLAPKRCGTGPTRRGDRGMDRAPR